MIELSPVRSSKLKFVEMQKMKRGLGVGVLKEMGPRVCAEYAGRRRNSVT